MVQLWIMKKHRKSFIRVTYFLQIRVRWILQISKIQNRSKKIFGQKLDYFWGLGKWLLALFFKCPSMRRSGNLSSLTLKLLVSSLTKKMLGVGHPGPGPLSNTHVKHHITLARNSHTNVTWARDSHNSKVNELLLLKGAKPKLDISRVFSV